MKIKNILFLISLIIFSSNICFAMESYQHLGYEFEGQGCKEVEFLTGGALFIEHIQPSMPGGGIEDLKISAKPGVLSDIKINFENGKLSIECAKANKDNFSCILSIKELSRLSFFQEADVTVVSSIYPDSSNILVSTLTGTTLHDDGIFRCWVEDGPCLINALIKKMVYKMTHSDYGVSENRETILFLNKSSIFRSYFLDTTFKNGASFVKSFGSLSSAVARIGMRLHEDQSYENSKHDE